MEPPPPPTDSSPKTDPVRPWVGLLVYLVLFGASQAWNGCERDKQSDERRREAAERKREAEAHDRKLSEVSARLEELDRRVKLAPPAHR